MATLTKERLAQLLAEARARTEAAKARELAPKITPIQAPTQASTLPTPVSATGMHGEVITYNEEQAKFISVATAGDSCILIGAAGTGKSTCQRGVIQSLIANNKAGVMAAGGHKYLSDGTPGIVVCAFTRRAVNNIRKVMPKDMAANCITIHKLLEYQPVTTETEDPETGKTIKVRTFEATRNRNHPLPTSIRTIVFEESSMISVEFFTEVIDALGHEVQFIFLGDIQQLPPVFGSAILGYKMLELPVVELKQVYRQALESPIIRLAHRILSGKPIPVEEYDQWSYPNQLRLHAWKKKLHPDVALLTMAKFFQNAIDAGDYKPKEDMILIPFNKAFGSDELNKHIAQHIAATNHTVTHEIIAGFNKYYYAVGDKVMYEKEDAVITDITMNALYVGKSYQPPSILLDRWGYIRTPKTADEIVAHSQIKGAPAIGGDFDVDSFLDSMSSDSDSEDVKREASHIITLRLTDSDEEITLSSAAGINSLSLSYAMTVHKAQGSESKKLFVVLHTSHATMVQRELLYTAVTRARESLYVICEPETFTKGIINQKIKGDTLAEKAEFFKGKIATKQLQEKLI